MHNIVYVTIPAEKVAGDTSKEHIDNLVDEILSPYCGEEAEEYHMDYYTPGGRWSGFSAVKKGVDCYPTRDGLFGYQLFDEYDVLLYNGEQRGPYIIDDIEYIPIIGAKKKDIEWNVIDKFNRFVIFKTFELIMDENFDGEFPKGFTAIGNELYFDSEKSLAYIKSETFEENCSRLGINFESLVMDPDAYVDKKGNWHSADSLWMDMKFILDATGKGEDVFSAINRRFSEEFYNYIGNLYEDDYIVIVDAHN